MVTPGEWWARGRTGGRRFIPTILGAALHLNAEAVSTGSPKPKLSHFRAARAEMPYFPLRLLNYARSHPTLIRGRSIQQSYSGTAGVLCDFLGPFLCQQFPNLLR